MSISQDELKKISEKLSKISADNPALLGNITDILSYMDLLSSVDTEGVVPTVSVVDGQATLRKDEILNPTGTSAKEMLSHTHQKVIADQIVLPNIMK